MLFILVVVWKSQFAINMYTTL